MSGGPRAASAQRRRRAGGERRLPQEACDAVYATPGYEQSVANPAQTSLERDMVFSDGFASQLATASGGVEEGYTLALNVGV